ncbi:ABC transporter ATP-binding protein [Simkania negevensis]|uniref:Uncharacterized ABC transporter ATP-binding protein YadG n=1 Tax=Simkania negevensis (strain ATCC VR-1471 / DSM 27360 / Z) TaxID=331113 RepID=F8L834_SIMNZ|nr:ABC transporter ATP-binding protein [Simkania negevensis]CCB88939.1 uncharacterized ABC transporter ATP-binding protein YadG [Simkania negevensis Z]
MKNPDPLLVKNLTKKYSSKTAVDQVSFSIQPGEVFGLLGPNGAGKTTIISTIMTLQNATSGTIEVFGINPELKPKTAKTFIGYVPQELVHHGFFNVEQILFYHAQYYGIQKKMSDFSYLLHKLDLYVHRKKMVNQLSGGMKRRLMIAKALIHEPKLLLLDEPSAGVDLELRNSLWEFIHELKSKNISILLTTHYLEEAEQLCDRIGILQHGRLRRVDKVDALLEQHSSKRVSLMLKTPKTSFSHPLLESIDATYLHFRIPPKMGIQELLAKIAIPYDEVLDLQVEPGTLEDVMENILNSEEE